MLNNFRQAFRINDFFMCFFFLSLIQFYKIIESFLMGPFICNLMDEKRFSSYLFCVVFFLPLQIENIKEHIAFVYKC